MNTTEKQASTSRKGNYVITENRKAYHEYFVLERYEVGLVLQGTEVKALRQGKVQMVDAHAQVVREELWLYSLHISPFEKGSYSNHVATRPRKLLMHRAEIKRLIGKQQEKGLTLVPLKLYFKDGIVKLELGVCKGKKLYDKRSDAAERDAKREVERAFRREAS